MDGGHGRRSLWWGQSQPVVGKGRGGPEIGMDFLLSFQTAARICTLVYLSLVFVFISSNLYLS
uniref:Uncharacterized protein n=1 Tax=Picea glauca TaxID=3330 RepID=A0A124GNM3_PICGL|nr:hypothetical protein ABT39_MTgene3845 [Picea glauca]